jgi:signal transduction histidine kinase
MNDLSGQMLRSTLDTLSSRLAVIDPTGRIVLVNRAWRVAEDDRLRLCRHEVGESFFAAIEQSYLRSGDSMRLRRGIEDVLAGKRGRICLQCRQHTRTSRTWYRIDVEGFELFGWGHARIALEETTAAKVAERRCAETRQRIRRVEARLHSRDCVISRMQEEGRLRNELIVKLAHELRNPLGAVAGAAEVLGGGGGEPRLLVRAREVIRRQVRRLTRLVDDVNDASSMVSDRLEVHFEPVDLQSVVAAAIQTTRPLIDQFKHTLITRIWKRPVIVAGDAARLTRAVASLLSNATRFTSPGGRITLICAHVGSAAVVRVRDTGIGISPEQLPRIFDLFFQVEPRAMGGSGGLGVGLALARQLAERHGGALTGCSDGPGAGSEFTLALPMARTGASRTLQALTPRRIDTPRHLEVAGEVMGRRPFSSRPSC